MKIEVYQDLANEWRWRIIAGNNKIVGGSEEGYQRRKHAEKMAAKIAGTQFPVVVKEDKEWDLPKKGFWKRSR